MKSTRHQAFCWLPLLLALLLTAGCSSRKPPTGDYGPDQPVDVSHIPDAVPRKAPRSRYGNPSSYTVLGKTYHVMEDATGFRQRGLASWYGLKFHGRRTSSGEPYDMYAMTAAHKTLPLPTWVRVTNQENGKSVVVKVNDRGPFHEGRIIDLSYTAAAKLGMLARGTAPVEIVALTTPGKVPFVTAAAGDHLTISQPVRNTTSGGSYLQAGAFSRIENARSLQRRLERVHDLPVEIRHDGKLHRVVVGPVSDADLQRRLLQTLKAWGIQPHPLTGNRIPSPTTGSFQEEQ
jgi:rare lipoprotein A